MWVGFCVALLVWGTAAGASSTLLLRLGGNETTSGFVKAALDGSQQQGVLDKHVIVRPTDVVFSSSHNVTFYMDAALGAVYALHAAEPAVLFRLPREGLNCSGLAIGENYNSNTSMLFYSNNGTIVACEVQYPPGQPPRCASMSTVTSLTFSNVDVYFSGVRLAYDETRMALYATYWGIRSNDGEYNTYGIVVVRVANVSAKSLRTRPVGTFPKPVLIYSTLSCWTDFRRLRDRRSLCLDVQASTGLVAFCGCAKDQYGYDNSFPMYSSPDGRSLVRLQDGDTDNEGGLSPSFRIFGISFMSNSARNLRADASSDPFFVIFRQAGTADYGGSGTVIRSGTNGSFTGASCTAAGTDVAALGEAQFLMVSGHWLAEGQLNSIGNAGSVLPVLTNTMYNAPNRTALNTTLDSSGYCSLWVSEGAASQYGVVQSPGPLMVVALNDSAIALNSPANVSQSGFDTRLVPALAYDAPHQRMFWFNYRPQVKVSIKFDTPSFWYLTSSNSASALDAQYWLSSTEVFPQKPARLQVDPSRGYMWFMASGHIWRAPVGDFSHAEVCVFDFCCGDFWFPPQHSEVDNFLLSADGQWLIYTVVADWGQGLNPVTRTGVRQAYSNCSGGDRWAWNGAGAQYWDNGAGYLVRAATLLPAAGDATQGRAAPRFINTSTYYTYNWDFNSDNWYINHLAVNGSSVIAYMQAPVALADLAVASSKVVALTMAEGVLYACRPPNLENCSVLPVSPALKPRVYRFDDNFHYYWDSLYQAFFRVPVNNRSASTLVYQRGQAFGPVRNVVDFVVDGQGGWLYWSESNDYSDNLSGLWRIKLTDPLTSSPKPQLLSTATRPLNMTIHENFGGALALSTDGKHVIWSIYDGVVLSWIRVVDIASRTVVRDVPIPRGQLPTAISVHPVSGQVWIVTAIDDPYRASYNFVFKCDDPLCATNLTLVHRQPVYSSNYAECLVGLELDAKTNRWYSLFQCAADYSDNVTVVSGSLDIGANTSAPLRVEAVLYTSGLAVYDFHFSHTGNIVVCDAEAISEFPALPGSSAVLVPDLSAARSMLLDVFRIRSVATTGPTSDTLYMLCWYPLGHSPSYITAQLPGPDSDSFFVSFTQHSLHSSWPLPARLTGLTLHKPVPGSSGPMGRAWLSYVDLVHKVHVASVLDASLPSQLIVQQPLAVPAGNQASAGAFIVDTVAQEVVFADDGAQAVKRYSLVKLDGASSNYSFIVEVASLQYSATNRTRLAVVNHLGVRSLIFTGSLDDTLWMSLLPKEPAIQSRQATLLLNTSDESSGLPSELRGRAIDAVAVVDGKPSSTVYAVVGGRLLLASLPAQHPGPRQNLEWLKGQQSTFTVVSSTNGVPFTSVETVPSTCLSKPAQVNHPSGVDHTTGATS